MRTFFCRKLSCGYSKLSSTSLLTYSEKSSGFFQDVCSSCSSFEGQPIQTANVQILAVYQVTDTPEFSDLPFGFVYSNIHQLFLANRECWLKHVCWTPKHL